LEGVRAVRHGFPESWVPSDVRAPVVVLTEKELDLADIG
jgi:hypothetical protein